MGKTKFFQKVSTEGAKCPGDCGTNTDEQPEWYDDSKMERAYQVFFDYSAAVNLSHLLGTVIMSQVASLVGLLLATGEHANLKTSEKRAVLTTYYIRTWYHGQVQNKEDQARKNVKLVRAMHLRASKKMNEEQPHQDGRVWLSQYDMALTQFAFIGALVLNPSRLGFWGSDEEVEAILYLWRYIGYLLGIEDQYNMCAGSYDQVKAICQDILQDVVKPTMADPQPLFTRTIEYAFAGYAKIAKGIRFPSMYNFTCDLLDYRALLKPLSMMETLSYYYFTFSTYLMSNQSFRALANKTHIKKSGKRLQQLMDEYKKPFKAIEDIHQTDSLLVSVWKYLLTFSQAVFDKLRKQHDV